jgi:fumarylacetoacetate (FAA) hydrolase
VSTAGRPKEALVSLVKPAPAQEETAED